VWASRRRRLGLSKSSPRQAYFQRTSNSNAATASRSDRPNQRCNTITVATVCGGTDRRPTPATWWRGGPSALALPSSGRGWAWPLTAHNDARRYHLRGGLIVRDPADRTYVADDDRHGECSTTPHAKCRSRMGRYCACYGRIFADRCDTSAMNRASRGRRIRWTKSGGFDGRLTTESGQQRHQARHRPDLMCSSGTVPSQKRWFLELGRSQLGSGRNRVPKPVFRVKVSEPRRVSVSGTRPGVDQLVRAVQAADVDEDLRNPVRILRQSSSDPNSRSQSGFQNPDG
jgi:hypothetical protein